MKNATQALTIKDIEAGYENPEWHGWGYLGERSREGANLANADTVVLVVANEQRWSQARLFEWLNSRNGRHFADMADGQSVEKIRAQADRWKIWTLRRG